MTDHLGLLAGLFIAVMITVSMAGYWLMGRIVSTGAGEVPSGWAGALQWMGELAPTTARDGDQLRRRLVAAGYRLPSATTLFKGIRYGSVVLAALLGLLIAAWQAWRRPPRSN